MDELPRVTHGMTPVEQDTFRACAWHARLAAAGTSAPFRKSMQLDVSRDYGLLSLSFLQAKRLEQHLQLAWLKCRPGCLCPCVLLFLQLLVSKELDATASGLHNVMAYTASIFMPHAPLLVPEGKNP